MQQLLATRTKTAILGVLYAATAVWWLSLTISGIRSQPPNYWYQVMLAIIPLVGGVFGLLNARAWGWLSSRVGRATFFLAAGLLTWGLGQCYWSYATISGFEEIPYPSLADVGYIISWPLWTAGVINLALAAGAKFSLKERSKVEALAIAAIVALAVSAVSYYLLIVVAKGGNLDFSYGLDAKTFFDLAYPIGDVIILTITALTFTLLLRYLGGTYKTAVLTIMCGYVLNYLTDFTFSYTTTAGEYFNGHYVDMMFPTVMTVLALGLTWLAPPSEGKRQ